MYSFNHFCQDADNILTRFPLLLWLVLLQAGDAPVVRRRALAERGARGAVQLAALEALGRAAQGVAPTHRAALSAASGRCRGASLQGGRPPRTASKVFEDDGCYTTKPPELQKNSRTRYTCLRFKRAGTQSTRAFRMFERYIHEQKLRDAQIAIGNHVSLRFQPCHRLRRSGARKWTRFEN